jgi:hypothetical protein
MRKLLMAGLALSLLACDDDDDDGVGPQDSVAGTYALISVSAQTLPTTVFQDATTQIEVLSGSLVLTATNTWTGTLSIRTTTNSVPLEETLNVSGTFTVTGNTITFTDTSDQSTFTGTRNGDTITATVELIDGGADTPVVFER